MYKDIDEAFSSAQISCHDVTPMPTRGISDEVRNEYKHLKKEIKYDDYIVVRRFAMMKEGRNPLQRALRYLLCNIAEYIIGCKAKMGYYFCDNKWCVYRIKRTKIIIWILKL